MCQKDMPLYKVVKNPVCLPYVMSELEWVLMLPPGHEALEDLDALVREARRRVPTADRGLGCTYMLWPEPSDSMIFRLMTGRD